MDPIHPIVPVTPNILPILPTPKLGQVDRDGERDTPDRRRRPAAKQPVAPGDAGQTDRQLLAGELPPGEEDDGLGHIDLTA